MAIQYADANADVVTILSDTYNISSSNNQLSVIIDGGSTQTFTLTNGSTRSAANIVSDLSSLTGATASVVVINGANFVRIRGTSANGATSTIQIVSSSNDAASTLGFQETTYTGGQTYVTNFIGGTKQQIINGVETALLAAGWITVSGHGSTNLLMQSSMTPNPQNLRMRIRIKDNSNNCAVISMENVSGNKAGANNTGAGMQLYPSASKAFKVIANKYQAFILVEGSMQARDCGCFGVVYLPPWLQGVIWECMWLQGSAQSDTDTGTIQGTFRTLLQVDTNGGNHAYSSQLCNGNFWDGLQSQTVGHPELAFINGANTRTIIYRWHDGSTLMVDPIIAWGLTGYNDEALFKGQLWNAFVSNDAFQLDTILSSIDTHNWQAWTGGNNGGSANSGSANQAARGTLFIAIS